MVTDILAWLNSTDKDYHKGLHLYDIAGGYQSVVTLLTHHRNPDKLLACMRQLKDKVAKQPAAVVPTTPTLTSDYVKKIDKIWHPLYTEMSITHARMSTVATDQDRLKLAKRIIALEEQCAVQWEKRDYYSIHRVAMPDKPRAARKLTKASSLNSSDHRRLSTLRSNLSHNKRELERLEVRILTAKDETELSQLEVKRAAKVAQMALKQSEIEKLEQ